jgi:glycine hydroxymethyltransferase
MKENDVEVIAGLIDKVLMNADDNAVIESVKNEVHAYMEQFPLYPELG